VSGSSRPAVDLCVNCYERTYREVLKPGFFPALVAEHRHPFARRTAIVNNVSDREDARLRAESLREAGELDEWYFVEDHIAHALATAGLREADIARAPHFTDWGLVLVSVPGPDWVVHCDPEVRMREPVDWIAPAIELLEGDRRLMVSNPRWQIAPPLPDTLPRSTFERRGDFAIGLGFSDQLFLGRRSELAAPIYSERCLAAWRYPMIGVTRSFEARIDSWMRHHDRLRATFLDATYIHPEEIGGGYSKGRLRERAFAFVGRMLIATARRSPVKRRCWRAL
jgi:hypothetical protein